MNLSRGEKKQNGQPTEILLSPTFTFYPSVVTKSTDSFFNISRFLRYNSAHSCLRYKGDIFLVETIGLFINVCMQFFTNR